LTWQCAAATAGGINLSASSSSCTNCSSATHLAVGSGLECCVLPLQRLQACLRSCYASRVVVVQHLLVLRQLRSGIIHGCPVDHLLAGVTPQREGLKRQEPFGGLQRHQNRNHQISPVLVSLCRCLGSL
jgi:hypothetical protein